MNIQNNIQEHITKFGYSVMGVFGTDSQPSFAYTIGLTESYQHPELLVFGLPVQTAHHVLNDIVSKIKAGKHLADGDQLLEIANLPLSVQAISKEAAKQYALQALYRYENSSYAPTFFQVVLPDAAGLFPWNTGYAQKMKAIQPELWGSIH